MPNSVRIVVQLPAPQSLADYEPFRPVDHGAFGMQTVTSVGTPVLADLARTCRLLFSRQVSVGFTTSPAVKALFFDMDATVIREESLVELAAHAGVQEQVKSITDRAMAGELDFRAALAQRVALLKGMPANVVEEVAQRLTLMPGISECVAFCRELNIPTFMISGGFVQLASIVARKVGIGTFHANTLGIANGKLTGKVVGPVVDAVAKQQFLLSTCAHLGLEPQSVAAIGDGANDLPMLTSAGVAVGHQPKAVLWPHLHAANWSDDHRFLVPLLFGRGLGSTRQRL